jgi:L-fuculose-phosphate aldolase
MNEGETEARLLIASFMKRLYERGLTTTSGGNLSIRVGSSVYITPSGSDKGSMKPEDIGQVSLEGDVIGRSFKPSIETGMHLGIYKTRPDVSAIVHAHPPMSSAFSATDSPIETEYLSESYAILGAIAYAPYRRMGSPELAAEVASASKRSNCVVMRNHGVLAVGKSMLEAFDRLEVLESTARINLLLLGALAGRAKKIPPTELASIDAMMGR